MASLTTSSTKTTKKKGQGSAPLPRFGRVKANLKMGIVGLPNVGKSSLFNLLSESGHADASNFPFCTIDPNEARCPVSDKRYEFLCDLWDPPSKYPAYLHLMDIAGLIKGASEGAGLGNEFLSNISAVDGLYHVVRAFDNMDIVHVEDSVDPVRDLDIITAELCAKDVKYVERCRADREKDVKKNPKMKLPPLFFSVMDKAMELLLSNQPLGKATWTAPEIEKINELIPQCLTTKPIVYLVNISKKSYCGGGTKAGNAYMRQIKEWVSSHGGGRVVPVSIQYEEELAEAREQGDTEAVAELLEKTGGRGSTLKKVIKVGYKVLNLQYFFTAGVKEVRCWTIMKGATAPNAAGVIHTDFEKKFVKAEVVSFEDFKATCNGKKGMALAKASGKYRLEGKNYVVDDGDIIYFKTGA